MANSSGTTCSDKKLLRKPSFVMEMKKQQPLMLLKDFLIRDDFSSCSSNGFKSFPRRQCCTATTVRYLLDRDLNRARDSSSTNSSSKQQRLLKRSRSSKAAAISALQRASVVVINAVKNLPFASVKSRSSSSSSSVQNYTRKGLLLPRSFSRKLLKRSFWKKTENGGREIQRLRSFSEFLQEKEQPSDSITVTTNTTAITTTTTTTTTTASSSNSNSWSGSEFTSDYLQCSSGNSESFGENDAVGGKKNSPEKKDSKRVGGDSMEVVAASTITYCIEPNVVKKGWPTEEEKEQFSPVSVLDCPFDDEEEICSPFRHRLARMEGKKQKLMQNIRRFESLAQLEPMDLEKRMALSEVDDSESLESPNQFDDHLTSTMAMDTATFEKIEKEIKTEQKAEELLNIIKTKIPSDSPSKYKSDKLILDFFRDRIEGRFVKPSGGDEQLLKVAEDWVNGNPHEVLLDWQVQDGRKAYIRDMEEEGEWRIEDEEKEEVGLEVEVEVWTCLVNELVLDVFFR